MPTSAAGESFLVSSILLLFTQRVKSKKIDRCPEDKSSGGVWGEAPGPCLRIWDVYEALDERGYNPIDQIVGYLLSGDPSYITSHKNARNLIRQIDRDDLAEVLVKSFLGK